MDGISNEKEVTVLSIDYYKPTSLVNTIQVIRLAVTETITDYHFLSTMFMPIKCMIQLPQENSIPEQKPPPVIVFYESN